jgi:hypothetical protein
MEELKEDFGLSDTDLNLDLGPWGVSCETLAASASVEQLLGGVCERQPLGYAGQREKPLHLLGSVDQAQAPTLLLSPLMGPDQHAEAGGVHELKLSEIDNHDLGPRLGDPLELLLEGWARCQVKLAADADHGRVLDAANLYPEMTLHCRRAY